MKQTSTMCIIETRLIIPFSVARPLLCATTITTTCTIPASDLEQGAVGMTTVCNYNLAITTHGKITNARISIVSNN